MTDMEKAIKGLEICKNPHGRCAECPYDDGEVDFTNCTSKLCGDALAMLKEQDARIQKYEYVFDFLGIGFRQWVTKILHGEAEVICETDEHEYKTVVTFKLI